MYTLQFVFARREDMLDAWHRLTGEDTKGLELAVYVSRDVKPAWIARWGWLNLHDQMRKDVIKQKIRELGNVIPGQLTFAGEKIASAEDLNAAELVPSEMP